MATTNFITKLVLSRETLGESPDLIQTHTALFRFKEPCRLMMMRRAGGGGGNSRLKNLFDMEFSLVTW
ncbi:hypothetical protein Bca4012_048646 [Brassica carinata]